jgi:nicotinamidase-related amidase
MKEVYFTPETLNDESAKLRDEITCHGKNRQLDIDINNITLLVLDMQEYFIDPASHAFVPSSPAIINGINELISTFRKKNLPVIFTKHINTNENAGQMKTQWKELITISNPLSNITLEINAGSSIVIEKTQYDAFYNTELEGILVSLGCETVVICGLMTHLCCESTARSAFIKGFRVVMPVDGTASYNRKFHLYSMYNLSHGFAYITQIKELINRCEEKKN